MKQEILFNIENETQEEDFDPRDWYQLVLFQLETELEL